MGKVILKKTGALLEMIKYQHSLHTLPFVYLGAFLARRSFPEWERLGWITLGMVAARALGLGLNRYIDRHIDGRNPRTAARALPAGLLSGRDCLLFCGLCLVFCLLAAYHLPPLVWLLSPFILFLFVFYPFTKRFTWSCHFWLGLTLGLAPLGGWAAVSGEIAPPAFLLSLAVLLLIAGSDIIYTCQDIGVDRAQGLYSIPSVFGMETALALTRILHGGCFLCLLGAGCLMEMEGLYFVGVTLSAAVMFWQNIIITPADIGRAERTFMTVNVFVSLVVFFFSLSSLSPGGGRPHIHLKTTAGE